jgi:hypothetical protein
MAVGIRRSTKILAPGSSLSFASRSIRPAGKPRLRHHNRVLNLDPSDQTAIRNASDALNHYQEQFEVAASTLPVGQAPADRYPGSGCGHQVLKQIEKRAPEIMDKYGLTLDALIEKHLVSKLQAKEVKVFCNDGKIVESNPVWSKNSNGLRWHNLWFPRLSSNRFR